jgi:hypothetical protein
MPLTHSILDYRLHFRDLFWEEESLAETPISSLTIALTSVNDQPITQDQAAYIMSKLPSEVVKRLWIMFSAERREDRSVQIHNQPWMFHPQTLPSPEAEEQGQAESDP